MIEQNFGEHENCFHTLDLYTAATLEHNLKPPDGPEDDWRLIMGDMEKRSCATYREIVFKEPQFNPYFIQATPGQELGSLNIGSRPSKRKSKRGVWWRCVPSPGSSRGRSLDSTSRCG